MQCRNIPFPQADGQQFNGGFDRMNNNIGFNNERGFGNFGNFRNFENDPRSRINMPNFRNIRDMPTFENDPRAQLFQNQMMYNMCQNVRNGNMMRGMNMPFGQDPRQQFMFNMPPRQGQFNRPFNGQFNGPFGRGPNQNAEEREGGNEDAAHRNQEQQQQQQNEGQQATNATENDE